MKKNIIQLLIIVLGFALFAHFSVRFSSPDKKARIHATESSLRSIRQGLEMVREKHGRYPTQEESLESMMFGNVLGLDQFRMGSLPVRVQKSSQAQNPD